MQHHSPLGYQTTNRLSTTTHTPETLRDGYEKHIPSNHDYIRTQRETLRRIIAYQNTIDDLAAARAR